MDNLVNNYYFLKQLSPTFKQQLVGRHVIEVYAQNQNEYVFSVSQDKDNWALVFYYGYQLSFAFIDKKAKPRAGAIQLFKSINGLQITNVQVMPNDRSLLVTLADQYQLLFKLYGAHGNVILFQNGNPLDAIRKRIQKDQTANIDNYTQTIDQSQAAYENLLNEGLDQWDALKQLFPTFTNDFRKALVRYGFEDKADAIEQWHCLEQFLDDLENSPVGLHHEKVNNLNDTGLRLSFFHPENAIETFSEPATAVRVYAHRFLQEANLLSYKQKLVTYWNNKIKKHKKSIKNLNQNLQKLIKGYDYRQLADLIMANLSTLEKGVTKPTLYDFYHDQWISVPLKKELSPQANAERFYQKGKRQHIELKTAEENLEHEEKQLAIAEAKYEELIASRDLKNLRNEYQELYRKSSSKRQSEQLKEKFKHFKVHDHDIYVGKGAAINDLLTFQFANKEDLWLHAREQKGAHVIIRSGKDKSIPDHVKEAAAQLAAYFAKGKGEAMTPVVCTRKKYVWKPRGADPGKVNYQHEKLLMVPPDMPELDG